MKLILVLAALSFTSPILANECEHGNFIVLSASCSDVTAKIQVRGERNFETLDRDYAVAESETTVQCQFSNEQYSLTVIEVSGKLTESKLFGCN